MSLLYLAAAVKAAKVYNKRYAKPSRKKPGWSDNKDVVIYREKQHTYFECLIKELAYDNESLYEFFEQIYIEAQNKKRKILEQYNEELKIVEKQQSAKQKGIEKLAEDLKDICVRCYFWSKDSNIKLFVLDGEFEGIDCEVFTDQATLEKYILDLKATAGLQQKYEKLIEESEQKIQKLRKKLKFTLFPSKKNDIKYYELNPEMNNLEINKQKLKECLVAKKVLKKFEELYENNKDKIQLFIKMVLEYKKLYNQILSISNKKSELRSSEKELELFETAFSMMVAKKKITEENLQKVYVQMDKVEIKGRRGEYKFGFSSTDFDGKCDHLQPLLRWFIKYVYEADKNFVDRNMELEEIEKESSKKK